MFRERFTSRVALDPPRRIDVAYSDGPFRYLNNHWAFTPVAGGCRLDFFVDFEFKSRILQKVIEVLFHEAGPPLVGAVVDPARHSQREAGAHAPRDAREE